jgi:hypothetical protein
MGTAILAALRDEITTCYLAAEMTEGQVMDRLLWMTRAHGHTPAQLEQAISSLRLVVLYRRGPVSWDDFRNMVGAALAGEQSGLLILDSINSLLAAMQSDSESEAGYWQLHHRICDAVIDCRRASEGRLGCLMISEMNSQGVLKGRQIEYQADVVVRMTATTLPRVVEIEVAKTREAGRDGKLGRWRLTASGTYQNASGDALGEADE